MNIIKKASVAANEQDAQEITQPYVNTGFETCQDIQTIKEQLATLSSEMSRYNFLASSKSDPGESAKYYDKAQHQAIRYWAIRWVMGWEKEVPE